MLDSGFIFVRLYVKIYVYNKNGFNMMSAFSSRIQQIKLTNVWFLRADPNLLSIILKYQLASKIPQRNVPSENILLSENNKFKC